MGEKRLGLSRQNRRCKAEMPPQVGNRKGQRRYSSEGTNETQRRREEPAGERSREGSRGGSGVLGQSLSAQK